VQVVEGGHRPHGLADPFSRRVRDASYRGIPGQIVLRIVRPRPSAASGSASESKEAEAVVSAGPATRSYRPSRTDTIVVGGIEYLPPRPLLVRNWASPDVEQFESNSPTYRPLATITGVVLHETRGPAVDWAPAVKQALEAREGLAIHGYINTDGSLIQHMDLTELLQHGGYFNSHSIGFEIINPMIPGAEHADRNVIPATWDSGKNAVGQYLVPPLIQLEGLVNLLRWLRGPPLNIPARWPGVRSTRSGNFFVVVPQGSGLEGGGRLNGVIGHGQYIRQGKSDGIFPALYCWLRIEAGLRPEDAHERAMKLLSEPDVTEIDLTRGLRRGAAGSSEEEAVRALRVQLAQEGAMERTEAPEEYPEDESSLPAAVVTAPSIQIFDKPDVTATKQDVLKQHDGVDQIIDKRKEKGVWWYAVRYRTDGTQKVGWGLGQDFSELADPNKFEFITPGSAGSSSPFQELRDAVAQDNVEPKVARLINFMNTIVLPLRGLTLPVFVAKSFYHALVQAGGDFKQASLLMTAAVRAFKPVAGGNFSWVQARTTPGSKIDPAKFRDKVWHFFWNAYERFSGSIPAWLDFKGIAYELKSRPKPIQKILPTPEPLDRDSTEDVLFNRGGVAFADWVMQNNEAVILHHYGELERSLRAAAQSDPTIAKLSQAEFDQVIARALMSPESERELQKRSYMDFADYAARHVELVLDAISDIPASVK
jgi:hypothetical protein